MDEWMDALAPEKPPIHMDPDGVLRVGGTRVTLDTVVGAYLDGASPEEIALGYDSLQLPDIHAAIGFYLRHTRLVDGYLALRQREEEAVRASNQRRSSPDHVRERLLARRAQAS